MTPGDSAFACQLARLYLERRDLKSALEHSAIAAELAPHDADVSTTRASVLIASRDLSGAWSLIEPLLAGDRPSVRLVILFTRIAPQLNKEPEALALILRLLEQSAYAGAADERGLRYAAAALLDSVERYDEAFEQARLAGILRGVRYQADAVESGIDRQIAYFTRAKIHDLPHATHGSEKPMFIVGMPRSGTSLVEQILATHPSVHGAGELDWMFSVATAAMQKLSRDGWNDFPQYFDRLSVESANNLAEIYLRPLLALDPQALRITDKMPLNFLHLGLIALLFPESRIIHCRRDPLDTCLSCFMTDFAGGNEFAYDLASLGHFYRQYERLMEHCKSALVIPILETPYEQLVCDPEPNTRRLLEFAGLPWDPSCLRFHENDRFINTASNEQIRRPMYQSSVGRWKHYDKHLAPLRKALGPE